MVVLCCKKSWAKLESVIEKNKPFFLKTIRFYPYSLVFVYLTRHDTISSCTLDECQGNVALHIYSIRIRAPNVQSCI